MHDDQRHLDLTFPSIPIGERETPPDLRRLLYKGGASLQIDKVNRAILGGLLGDVLPNRVELVRLIHDFINGELAGGGSAATARIQIREIVAFFDWADRVGTALSIPEVQNAYLNWTEHLLHRVRVVKDMKPLTAYNYARITGHVLDGVMGRETPIVESTRIRRPHDRKTPQGAKADKQNLHGTFAFGRLLQDICDGTSLNVIYGPRLVRIPLQQGGEIEFWPGRKALPEEKRNRSNVRKSMLGALAYETDRSLDHGFRRELVNLRIQAEMLMFIGQTGMNLTQAQGLPLRHFNYSSDIDGYKVREYKSRRKGEVLFEIFSEYRSHFERYLEWRRELFPDTQEKRLFPLIRQKGTRECRRPSYVSIKGACKKTDIPWTPPSMLRGTRVNWLLRRSGDPDITAEMAQHHKQTLLKVYETPSLQRAVCEIMRFHLRNDPALASKDLSLAVAPGECDGIPITLPIKPESAPEPDCKRPSGCLWCEHHRDIDSFDYVWSLACFRHLKLLELSRHCPTKNKYKVTHPAEHVTQRLSEKLSWFRESNATRREWVVESLARLDEGYYHDQWSYLIEAVEGVSE